MPDISQYAPVWCVAAAWRKIDSSASSAKEKAFATICKGYCLAESITFAAMRAVYRLSESGKNEDLKIGGSSGAKP